MVNTLTREAGVPLTLGAGTAEELMTANPLSIRDVATVREAVAFLIDHGISAAPVIDQAGQPAGVLSRSDLIVHEREKGVSPAPVPAYYDQSVLSPGRGGALPGSPPGEARDQTLVRDLMTPVVFAVSPRTPAGGVVEQMVDLKVHRLFVVDDNGVLVGVITALDVLRHLLPRSRAPTTTA
jgi:CBS domain-containing protein